MSCFTKIKRRLKDRFNEHRRTIDDSDTKSKPTTVAKIFFSSSNYTADDKQLIPIEHFLISNWPEHLNPQRSNIDI